MAFKYKSKSVPLCSVKSDMRYEATTFLFALLEDPADSEKISLLRMSRKYGTCKTVKTGFWPGLSNKIPCHSFLINVKGDVCCEATTFLFALLKDRADSEKAPPSADVARTSTTHNCES